MINYNIRINTGYKREKSTSKIAERIRTKFNGESSTNPIINLQINNLIQTFFVQIRLCLYALI